MSAQAIDDLTILFIVILLVSPFFFWLIVEQTKEQVERSINQPVIFRGINNQASGYKEKGMINPNV